MPKAPDQERKNNSETIEARSRTGRPGRMQEQPEHSIAANDEPPVLASMKLASGETVYVELSPEGQRRMRVEKGTIVQLFTSDVAERHRHDKGHQVDEPRPAGEVEEGGRVQTESVTVVLREKSAAGFRTRLHLYP